MPSNLVDEIKQRFGASAGNRWIGPATGVVIVLVLLGAACELFIKGARVEQIASIAEAVAGRATPPPSGLVVGDVDVGKELNGALEGLNQALKTVTDAASAKAALPKITEIGASVDKLKAVFGQLSDSGKAMLSDLVAKALPAEKASLDRLYGIPGVADVLNPAIDPVLATLNEAARKPG